jgi:hypothetical protein
LLAGAVKATLALALPAITVVTAGAPGTVDGVTLLLAVEAAPAPSALLAVTVKVYAVPLVRPVTVMGLLVPVPVNPPGLDVTV